MRQAWISCRVFSAQSALLFAVFFLVQSVPGRSGSLSSYDPQANQLLARMTLEEKIGQMIQAESTGLIKISDIETYYLGSILNSGDADPPSGNTLEYWTEQYESLQKRTQYTRLKIPLLYGVDAVHGHNNVLGAVIFPHNIGLGCTRNPELVREIGRITAREVRATGIQWTFAPCVAVPQDERWGRTYEGFSEDPQLCALLGAAAIRGLQGDDLRSPYSILACAKHYVGDGGTLFGTSEDGRGLDQGDVRVDEETLRRIHLHPYPAAIQAGAATIMPSYSSWNGVKCSANRYLLTKVLKEELGFEGFLISDYNAIHQVHPDFKVAIGICVNAGMDMAMEPNRYREFFVYLKELVEEGTVPMSRIDDAVRRILRVKYAMGLMDKGYSLKANRRLQKEFGSEAHRRVARQAVRESLVLLKNKNQTLPLSKKAARIHVAGRSADNLGNQCGGWTITWQGQSGPVTLNGTTVLTAIRRTVSEQTLVTYSDDGKRAEGADVAVVVIGERPYAEGYGDRENLEISREDKRVIENVKKAGIPIVVVLFSGRPLILGEVLDQADALIAAWLPGTEGQGIADVLFGDYKPTGKLSFSWPKSMDQIPINLGDKPYEPLFEYGYGLTY
ncbi:MAG TPA: glycoside hydrolase family 3 N-terminal domain-containing protein [Anaerohalosphaeraceae bacterium]|nr:glycoside hydrolase family 3 N-terminal domain-containing protein [Anaerohalosphaeraceae bacterium]HOL88597.1 glycoside hydrolase family 3 N-terminal domain-containing protein [Anaerohalosphaeraceae bacterium]HPP56255.1 glycoside hydrolase family 3 N-terminal domain-containing protein [Anaerohalosphaeraceae bacterium]